MTIVRVVSSHLENWKQSFAAEDPPEFDGPDMPFWMISAFAPAENEKGVSFFEVDGDVTTADVIAAIYLRQGKAKPHVVLSASRASLEEAGFAIDANLGKTDTAIVNAKHCEITLNTVGDLTKIARIFLAGELEFYDVREIKRRLVDHARLDQVNWLSAAQHPEAWKKGGELTKDGAVKIVGQPLAA